MTISVLQGSYSMWCSFAAFLVVIEMYLVYKDSYLDEIKIIKHYYMEKDRPKTEEWAEV